MSSTSSKTHSHSTHQKQLREQGKGYRQVCTCTHTYAITHIFLRATQPHLCKTKPHSNTHPLSRQRLVSRLDRPLSFFHQTHTEPPLSIKQNGPTFPQVHGCSHKHNLSHMFPILTSHSWKSLRLRTNQSSGDTRCCIR